MSKKLGRALSNLTVYGLCNVSPTFRHLISSVPIKRAIVFDKEFKKNRLRIWENGTLRFDSEVPEGIVRKIDNDFDEWVERG